MHYLIDGYNLLFFSLPPNDALQKNREALICQLDNCLSFLKAKALIIFDGFNQPNSFLENHYFENVQVIFTSKNLTADEYILELLSFSKTPGEYSIITADKQLALQARALKASTQTPQTFLKWIAHKSEIKKTSLTTEKPDFEETKTEFERLLKVFEKKLKEENF